MKPKTQKLLMLSKKSQKFFQYRGEDFPQTYKNVLHRTTVLKLKGTNLVITGISRILKTNNINFLFLAFLAFLKIIKLTIHKQLSLCRCFHYQI